MLGRELLIAAVHEYKTNKFDISKDLIDEAEKKEKRYRERIAFDDDDDKVMVTPTDAPA